MEHLFVILLFLSPFLLLATHLLTFKSKSFWKLFIAHGIAFIIYMTFVSFYSKTLTGHDEYGPGKIGLALMFITWHIVIGFFLGLFIKYKKQQYG